MIYLAAPYTHESKQIEHQRFKSINEYAARLMRDGLHVFSPISHTHPIAQAGDLPGGWEYWQGYDKEMLSFCTSMVVLMLAGWEESKGIAAEVRIANGLGLPIYYADPLHEPGLLKKLETQEKKV